MRAFKDVALTNPALNATSIGALLMLSHFGHSCLPLFCAVFLLLLFVFVVSRICGSHCVDVLVIVYESRIVFKSVTLLKVYAL